MVTYIPKHKFVKKDILIIPRGKRYELSGENAIAYSITKNSETTHTVKVGVYRAGLRHYHNNMNGCLLTECSRMTEVTAIHIQILRLQLNKPRTYIHKVSPCHSTSTHY
jgi:hypothetical protein